MSCAWEISLLGRTDMTKTIATPRRGNGVVYRLFYMSHFYPKSLRCVSSMHRPPPGTSNNSPAAVDVHMKRPSSLTVCILFMLPWLHHSSCYHCYATLHVTMVTPFFMLPLLRHSSCYHCYATHSCHF